MHSHVHCGTVYNSKDLEATQVPIKDRLDKENVAHIQHGILCSHKNDKFVSFVGTWMNLETIVLQQTDARTENQTTHVFPHRHVVNNESTWVQGGEHHTLG